MLTANQNLKCEQKKKKVEEKKGLFSNRDGSIIVSLSVLAIGMLALTALAVDYAMEISYKRSLQNVTEIMAIAAMGYHTDENFDGKVAQLSPGHQHWAKTTLGLRNAYLVWNSTINSLAKSSKFSDPFGGVDWSAKYETLMSDIKADGDIDTNPLTSGYDSSKVRFLQKSFVFGDQPEALMEPIDIDTVGDPLLIRAVENEITTLHGGSPIKNVLSKYFGATEFNVTARAVAEVANSGKTNAVVLLIDRSISMAGKTGDSTYIPDTQPPTAGYNEAYPGLSSSDLTAMQNSAKVIQPMTDMLYAARVVPKILGRANWFVKDTNRYSRLSLMAFDLATESVGAAQGASDHVDNNTCSGCDGYENAYKKIQDRINAHLTGSGLMGRPGLPELAGLCVAPQACMECYAAGCKSTCDPVNDEIFHSVNEAKCFASTGAGMALPAAELDSFFPWSASNESQGLEVAIELIRQQRKLFNDLFNGTSGFKLDEEFQGQIILFSDGLVNAFHDQDHVKDNFPKYNFFGYFTHYCDDDIWNDYPVRDTAPSLDPGVGQTIDQPRPIPVAWRKDFNSPFDMKPAVTWILNCQIGNCSDVYHNGSQKYADQLSGSDPFSPEPPALPSPMGVWSEPITGAGLAGVGVGCPDYTCNKVLVGRKPPNIPGDETRKPGIDLFCPDLHFMDYVDWANANGIIINTVGFGDLGSTYNPSAPTDAMRRQFLLTYATDPDEDNKRKGFFLTSADATCGAAGTGCPKFQSALRRAFTNIEGRLTDKTVGSLIT